MVIIVDDFDDYVEQLYLFICPDSKYFVSNCIAHCHTCVAHLFSDWRVTVESFNLKVI